MVMTPEQLTMEYRRRVEAGENVGTALIDVALGQSPKPAAPDYLPPIPIDRGGTPDEQLAHLVAGVASLLVDWTLHDKGDRYSRWQLENVEGATVYFHLDRGKRIEISGSWPRCELDNYMNNPYHGEDTPYTRITVALSRSAEAIAGELERRFLPGYLSEYHSRLVGCAKRDDQLLDQAAVTRELAAIVGAEPRYQYNSAERMADNFIGYDTATDLKGCKVDSSTSIGLEISTSKETAAAILRLLVERGKQ